MKTEIATLAGGCFWGVEELFRSMKGVIQTEVGYTGGITPNPTYETVKTGTTGHAESIEITFDPEVVSYEAILKYFFQLHDPTTENRQGNDRGSQYRSAIFYHSDAQKAVAEKVIAAVNASGQWGEKVVTQVIPAEQFYSAEAYHQDYLQKHPGGYTCHWVRPYKF
jgi:peptide-methionine (S)-S-oxide reductase